MKELGGGLVLAVLPLLVGAARPLDCRLRVAAFVPAAAAIDWRLDDTLVAESVGYGRLSAPVETTAGEHQIRLIETVSGRTLVQERRGFSAGAFTLLAIPERQGCRVVTLTDEAQAAPAGLARVRLVGAADRAPRLVALLSGPGGEWALGPVGLGETNGYLSVPSGAYRLTVHAAAGRRPGARLKTLPYLPLGDGGVYSIYAGGVYGQTDGPAWRAFRIIAVADVAPAAAGDGSRLPSSHDETPGGRAAARSR